MMENDDTNHEVPHDTKMKLRTCEITKSTLKCGTLELLQISSENAVKGMREAMGPKGSRDEGLRGDESRNGVIMVIVPADTSDNYKPKGHYKDSARRHFRELQNQGSL